MKPSLLNFIRSINHIDDLIFIYQDIHNLFMQFPDLLWHHGIHHARRVTQNAFQLLENEPSQWKEETIIEIALACLFHETGMTQTKNHFHSHESILIFNQYLNKLQHLPLINQLSHDSMARIENAIRLHETKEISIHRDFVSEIVNQADNIDAFGFVGVFRYLAIYDQRGWTLDDMIQGKDNKLNLLKNLDKRFQSLSPIAQNQYLSAYQKSHYFFKLLPIKNLWAYRIGDTYINFSPITKMSRNLFDNWKIILGSDQNIIFNNNYNIFFQEINSCLVSASHIFSF